MNERDNLPTLHERLTEVLNPLNKTYEIVFVDDGSTDDSFVILQGLALKDNRVKVVRLSRNYGQTPATRAGIDHSSGNVIVTMDGDLQNDPLDIPVFLAKLEEGYDGVLGQRVNRKDGMFLRKIPSWLGNWLIRKVTGVHIHDLGCARYPSIFSARSLQLLC